MGFADIYLRSDILTDDSHNEYYPNLLSWVHYPSQGRAIYHYYLYVAGEKPRQQGINRPTRVVQLIKTMLY